MIIYILIFIISIVLIYFSGEWIVKGLMRMARFLGWKEFVVAFFVMAFAASLPNLFVGISSALQKIPQLSFGDIAGNNLVALTVAVALAAFFSKGGLPAESRTIQTTSVFTMVAAILPLILILDGTLSRIEGLLLIFFFAFYIFWLFSKKERFTKVYNTHRVPPFKEFKTFIKDLGKVVLGIILLIGAAQGIIISAQFFAVSFNLSIILMGLLVTGFGSALPEIYFAVVSAKKGESWMILGDLMGAVIIPTTLVLGIVAIICPIEIQDFSSFAIARFFLIITAMFFLFFVRTDRKITRKEALFLLGTYITFVAVEILAI
ncbi:MAG: hypothetical protein AUJ31_02375 [Parcubacteria group bacterium CG1_02_39_15]|uniref:Sodium/calcium exchanger membrane region domain-containing protein n=4 Tax=Candidatus Nealsoniibacteriota TaxID=1817911 RepID=A0A2G9YSN2_9BACT|nr:MAG: hypothetical protein AUJ31_02375 [Parcubacteria group bacterium CG1_02_39_15]PIP22227.1 MAG: hypothetical protein COX38_01765 [Candidatus Nealsonbacteria bacterium CG23_combo_of_CG06-09_8_20_14_all_39_25]PIQ98423.1 MAG: hypothetical protein COV64_01285 [Candidatus Nealsonbacteria bacterium CG11_big_fil_rev_8_21_14_0_20_39_9]PIZ88332.1 MAG: hypothetical protein COX91_00685 [Candidatus Nealsonbacteria bacterium CG_4_10_14_0_2_um_filter_39_15]